MNLKELAKIICDVFEIEDITQATTPEGRWRLLQYWLKNNPRWKTKVAYWSQVSPDQAYDDLCAWISQKAELPVSMLKVFIDKETRERVRTAIETIQSIYRERQQFEKRKEIKDVNVR